MDAAKKVLHESEKAVHEHRDSEDLVAWMALHAASRYRYLGELTKCAAEALLLARQTSEQLAAITPGQAGEATGALPSSGTALNNGNEKELATNQANGFRDVPHRAG